METRRELLTGREWDLFRGPLRPEDDASLPTGASLRPAGRVHIPGNLQLQLGFADPWLDEPELAAVNDDEWLHATTFTTLPELKEEGSRALLAFAGVDYFCDVWVNGRHVGRHEGVFAPFELDVTDALAPPGADNELAVAVSCPWRLESRTHFVGPSTVLSPFFDASTNEYLKGNLSHYWDGLPLCGYAVFPLGICGDVELIVRSGVHPLRVSVSTLEVGADEAELELCCEWWNPGAERKLELEVRVEPETFAGPAHSFAERVAVAAGESESRIRFRLPEPRLWWTWDSGPQDLYSLTARAEGATARTIFGVRTIERDPETLAYSINGRRLFLRGVWYPFASIFTSLPTPDELGRDAEMLRDANVNHIVVFTFVERAALYEACDRLGILVFQELPFTQLGPMQVAEPDYPRRAEYRATALAQVETVVRRLRGHPSLVLWAAFAETRTEGRWIWGDYDELSEAVAELVRRGDPDALYHPSLCDFGEVHIWDGGMPWGDFTDHYERNHKLISEFGAIAPPVVETLRDLIAPESIWGCAEGEYGRVGLPIDVEEYAFHWSFDYQGLCNSVARVYQHVDRAPPTLERFVDAVQWYQAYGLRYCAEAYRRKRFREIAACRTWSYRDTLPGIKFTVVDHRQRPKLGYFGLQAGYAPLLLSVDDREPLRPRGAGSAYKHDLWIVNDGFADEPIVVTARLLGTNGEEHARWEGAVQAEADSGHAVFRLELPLPAVPAPCLLRLEATRSDGSTAATGDVWIPVVRPAFDPPLRVLLLGQSRYSAPVVQALHRTVGIEIEIVDETTRSGRDPSWGERLQERVDVVWFTGWDTAARQFSAQEWRNLADAVERGVGLIHSGGQASFHGGDGRGAMLDYTPLAEALPVLLRPHDAVWDRPRPVERTDGCDPLFSAPLETMPFVGFSRTEPRPEAAVHWRVGEYPLVATGRFGAGRTAVFTASLTEPFRVLPMEDPGVFVDDVAQRVEPYWTRPSLKSAPERYWSGTLELALGLLAYAADRVPAASPAALADEYRRPLFEQLAELGETALACEVSALEWDDARGQTSGRLVVRNAGPVVARVVRGTIRTAATRDWRFRDGFVDLLPGEERALRFESACRPEAIEALELRGQNTAATSVPVTLEPTIPA